MSTKCIESYENSFPHGVMFHHFHDEHHPKSQGSISAEQFESMLSWLAERRNILSASDFTHKLNSQKLENNDICITFDDALLCQFEVALPILRAFKIQAFFFIYTSPFHDDPDPLEIYRIFRNSCFSDIDIFYEQFFSAVSSEFRQIFSSAMSDFKKIDYLYEYEFYSHNDKWFRYLRDRALSRNEYFQIMEKLMIDHEFDAKEAQKSIWMTSENLNALVANGQTIGLHSYSHPVSFQSLDKKTQEWEYRKNFEHLKEITGISPVSMSHPFGNYNHVTLEILDEMKIQIGFRDNCSIKEICSIHEVPREDHTNVLSRMQK